ncbi:MAG: DUF4116 domain-containing protein [Bacteroidota bacterium]|jgi:hypothetical protein
MTFEEILQLIADGQIHSKALHTTLIEDPSLALRIVRYDGNNLQYLPESLRDDKGIVLEAVQMNGLAIQYASTSLRAHWSIALSAVLQNRQALHFIAEQYINDRVFLLIIELICDYRARVWQQLLHEYETFIRLGAVKGASRIDKRENIGGKLFLIPYRAVEIADLNSTFWEFLSERRWERLLKYDPLKAEAVSNPFGGFLLMQSRECFATIKRAKAAGLLRSEKVFSVSVNDPSLNLAADAGTTNEQLDPGRDPDIASSDKIDFGTASDLQTQDSSTVHRSYDTTLEAEYEVGFLIENCMEKLEFLERHLLSGINSGLSALDLLGLFPEAKSVGNVSTIASRAKSKLERCLGPGFFMHMNRNHNSLINCTGESI